MNYDVYYKKTTNFKKNDQCIIEILNGLDACVMDDHNLHAHICTLRYGLP